MEDEGEGAGLAPASAEEKDLLKRFVARDATDEERDAFLQTNAAFLSEKSKRAFTDMSAKDQFRVIADGPMTPVQDSTEILYGRVKRFKDMEMQVRCLAFANHDAPKVEKPKDAISNVSLQIAQAMANPVLEEVPENERRCTPMAVQPNVGKDASQLEGSIRGVGGVIEALQKKYGLQKGDRVRVIAETKELWKLEGEKTVPKVHSNSGWKWVLKGAEEEAKKKAIELARKKLMKEEAKRHAEEEAKAKEKKASSNEKVKKKKSKNRSSESEAEGRKQKASGKSKRGSSCRSDSAASAVKRKCQASRSRDGKDRSRDRARDSRSASRDSRSPSRRREKKKDKKKQARSR